MRFVPLSLGLVLTGCGMSAPPAEMPARTWKYYFANPAEIEPMQKICRQWSATDTPASAEPAIVAGNCRAAAFAQSMLKAQRTGPS